MKNYRWIHVLVCLFVVALAARPVFGQSRRVELGQVDTSDYPNITLYVNVTDESGANVGGLTQADFTVTEDGQVATIVDFAGVGEARPVDIVFVFDTTGSMDDEIDGLKRTAIDFAHQLRANNRDFRLGLVDFKDTVERRFNNDGTLTDNENEFQGWVSNLRAGGGDDTPENAYAAIKAASQMNFRGGAQIIFILITDAPPHHYGDGSRYNDPDLTVERQLAILSDQSITLYPVAYNDPEYRHLATETGGRFYDLQLNPDFTGIIDEIGATIASQYKITYESTRPTPDGTRRGIVVTVGSGSTAASGEAEYLEQHLLNIHSNWLIGLLLLIPLLGALALPRFWPATAPIPAAPPYSQSPPTYPPPAGPAVPYTPPPVVPAGIACPRCQSPNKAGARFCATCGQSFQPAAPTTCPHCHSPIRPGAKFCAKCGRTLT
jgi:VWFA-related protein